MNQMPATRSGFKHSVGPQHQGRHAHSNGTLSSLRAGTGGSKRGQDFVERRATRFATSQRKEKRIKLGTPAPPAPTKDGIIMLERATRGANPTCLHFGVKKDVPEFLHPDHFFCGHCDDCAEAMTHSVNKKAVKRNSRAFVCQGEHTNFIAPATLKEDRRHHVLLAEDAKESDKEDAVEMSASEERVLSPTTPATKRATAATVTPAALTPASVENHGANDDALKSLQANYDDVLGKEVQTEDKLNQLQSKMRELSEKVTHPRHLQKKHDDLLKRHQSLVLKTMDPTSLVLHVINLPFEDSDEFDGSDAVINDSKVKKQEKVRQFVCLMLTQTQFFDGLVRNET
jgi:hypothetical protein